MYTLLKKDQRIFWTSPEKEINSLRSSEKFILAGFSTYGRGLSIKYKISFFTMKSTPNMSTLISLYEEDTGKIYDDFRSVDAAKELALSLFRLEMIRRWKKHMVHEIKNSGTMSLVGVAYPPPTFKNEKYYKIPTIDMAKNKAMYIWRTESRNVYFKQKEKENVNY